MSSFLYRLGQAAARHRWRTLGIWIATVVAIFVIGGALGGKFSDDFNLPDSESQRAYDLLAERYPAASGTSAYIVFHAPDGPLEDQADAVNSTLDTIGGPAARDRRLGPVRDPGRPLARRHDRLRAGRLRPAGLRPGRRAVPGAPGDPRRRPLPRPGGGDRRRVRLVGDAARDGHVRADRPAGRDDHPADRVRLRGRDGTADRDGRDRPRHGDRPRPDPGGVRARAGVRHDPVVDDRAGRRDRLRPVHRHALPAEPARRHGAAARDRPRERHGGAGRRVLRRHRLDRAPRPLDLGDRVRRHDGDRRGDRRPGGRRRGRHAAARVPRLRGQRDRQAERPPQAQDRRGVGVHQDAHVVPMGPRGGAASLAVLRGRGHGAGRPRHPAVLDEARVPR